MHRRATVDALGVAVSTPVGLLDETTRATGPKPRPPAIRFWAKVDKTDGCWVWTGRLTPTGYGRLGVGSKRDSSHRSMYAHVFAYGLLVGPVPAGLELDHLCRNRGCVNPAHLEPVTRRINLLRGDTFAARHAAATECPQGHPYDDANTYWRPDRASRDCKTCRRERKRVGARSKVA